MTSHNQKKQAASERHHFEVFLRCAGIQYRSFEQREAPDFLLTLDDGRSVAVEHRELVWQQLAEHLEMIDRTIVAPIKKALQERHVAVDVLLFWKPSLTTFAQKSKSSPTGLLGEEAAPALSRRKTAKLLVKQIIEFVRVHEQADLHAGTLTVEDESLDQPLSNIGLDLLSAVVLERREDPAGEVVVQSIPMDIQAGEQGDTIIETAIKGKQNKLSDYRAAGFRKVWLLLVTGADFVQPVIPSLLKRQSFSSTFNRVYLLDLWRTECLRLHSA